VGHAVGSREPLAGLPDPIAPECALKRKEISYIHAETCPAGELRHGPRPVTVIGLSSVQCRRP